MENLPDMMDAHRKKTGLKHMVFVPYGWEGRSMWAGINDFPTIPSDEAWVKVNAELKRRGHRTAFLTSGYWWVVKRKKTGNGPAFDDAADFERRKGMCVQKADGAPWTVDWYDRTKQFGSWRGLSAALRKLPVDAGTDAGSGAEAPEAWPEVQQEEEKSTMSAELAGRREDIVVNRRRR